MEENGDNQESRVIFQTQHWMQVNIKELKSRKAFSLKLFYNHCFNTGFVKSKGRQQRNFFLLHFICT